MSAVPKFLKPKKHQIKGAKFAVNAGYTILAMDMGTGKSGTALRAWQESGGGKLTIVAPSPLVLNWVQEIKKWYGEKHRISVFTKGADIYDVWATDIVIITYDLGKRSEFFFEWCDYLIIDEGQELKNLQNKRTEYYHKVIYENSIPGLSILTGTPIKNRVEEYYSLMAICYYNPKIKSDFLERFPDSTEFAEYFSWKKEYTIKVRGQRIKLVKYEGYRNVKELKKYLAPIYYRVKFEDVVRDLPPVVYKDILMSSTPDEDLLKEYKRLAKVYIEDEDAGRLNSKRKRESALEKVPFTIKYVKDLAQQVGPVVVYTDHIESCEAIAKALGVFPITGKVPGSRRFKISKDFQDGKAPFLVATIGALNSGVDLIRASNLVFNDLPYVPGNLAQVIGRIRRIGQTRKCIVHRILGSPQDQKISDILQEKMETIMAVT